jgi:glucose/arabinose dehydrogenase
MWSEASDFQGEDLIALAVSVAALKVTFLIARADGARQCSGIPRASTITCLWSRRMLKILLIAVAAVAFLTNDSVPATAADERSAPLLKGKAAFGDWQEDEPGVRRLLTLQDQPLAAETPQNFAEVVPIRAGAKPRVPTGFSVEMVASGLAQPCVLRVAPNGDLFVADSVSNTVRVLRIPPGSAKPSNDQVFASGLYQPYGIAFYPLGPNPDCIYIANSDSVVRYPYKNGDLKAAGEAQTIVKRIPWVHHWTRDIVFTPNGQPDVALYRLRIERCARHVPRAVHQGRPGRVDQDPPTRRNLGHGRAPCRCPLL